MAVIINCHKLSGVFTSKITVTTNDPSHPTVLLECRGRILEPVKLDSNRLAFGKLSRKGPPRSKKIMITRGDGGPVSPNLRPFDLQGVQAQVIEIEPGERYELEIALRPPFETGRLQASLTLATGVPEAPSVSILVFAGVLPRVAPEPRRVKVPPELPSEWTQALSLVWDDEAEHKILSATVSDPRLTVQMDEEDGRQQVVLRVPPEYVPGPAARYISISTDDSQTPLLRVPIIFARTQPGPGKPANRETGSGSMVDVGGL